MSAPQSMAHGRVHGTGESGFAFPTVLFILVILSVGSLFFIFGSSDERLAQNAMKDFTRTFYTTDAGVNNVVASWKAQMWDTLLLNSGDSVDLGWTELEDGSSYHAMARRTDANGANNLYTVRVTGSGPEGREGRSVRYLDMVKAPWDLNIEATVKGGSERFEADHNAVVTGEDTTPAGWESACQSMTPENKPAAKWHDPTQVEINAAATVTGDPVPVEIDPTQNQVNVFQWADFDYDDLAAMADIVIPGDSDITDGIGPRVVGGECDTGWWKNWGAPLDPSSPCFDYFPIIHVKGNGRLRIRDHSGSGQGIILVDEPGSWAVRWEDDFQFFGVVIGKGEVRMEENSRIHGGIISGNRSRFERDSVMRYSSCAIQRAVLGAGLYALQPLTVRAQRQAF